LRIALMGDIAAGRAFGAGVVGTCARSCSRLSALWRLFSTFTAARVCRLALCLCSRRCRLADDLRLLRLFYTERQFSAGNGLRQFPVYLTFGCNSRTVVCFAAKPGVHPCEAAVGSIKVREITTQKFFCLHNRDKRL